MLALAFLQVTAAQRGHQHLWTTSRTPGRLLTTARPAPVTSSRWPPARSAACSKPSPSPGTTSASRDGAAAISHRPTDPTTAAAGSRAAQPRRERHSPEAHWSSSLPPCRGRTPGTANCQHRLIATLGKITDCCCCTRLARPAGSRHLRRRPGWHRPGPTPRRSRPSPLTTPSAGLLA